MFLPCKTMPFETVSDLECGTIVQARRLFCSVNCVSPHSLSLSLSWTSKQKQAPFRSHLFQISRRHCSCWCASFLNKSTMRQANKHKDFTVTVTILSLHCNCYMLVIQGCLLSLWVTSQHICQSVIVTLQAKAQIRTYSWYAGEHWVKRHR